MRSNNSEYAEFLRVLKEKNDLVDVIGSYLKLERRGYDYWACCPFHHEKTPSFHINAADKYYHCFGCGESGDIISFVKGYENVDYAQAVQILAARVGLEVPAFDDRSAEENAEKKRKRDRLLALCKDTARFYLNNLYSGRAEKHLAYLAKRGVSPSTMKKFGIGASLDFDALPSHLLAQGYTAEECIESGVCAKTEKGRLFDSLGGRLIIPIINHMDEVIAFGGRLLEKSDRAKYKNTRETVLFNKSKNLYNINLVKKEKRAGGLSSVIMVEGYMDAISLYEAGFHNVVASMGTSLTKEQARLCKRYSENVFISYDGDFAGQKANLRGLDIFKQEGIKVRVVPMPEGLDPDDVIQKRGAEGYRKCLDNAMPLIDYRIFAAQRKYDLNRTDEKRDFVREALGIVREAESATEREELLKKISSVSGVTLSALMRDLEALPALPAAQEPKSVAVKEDSADGIKKAARFVLAACLLSKPYAMEQDLSEIEFTEEEHRVIAQYIAEGRETGTLRPSGIFDLLGSDSAELCEVLNLDYGDNLDSEAGKKYFLDSIATLQRRTLAEKKALETEKLAAASPEEKREILARIDEYTKKMKNIRIGGKI
ncbi:MAG: DNA primase [Clostridia bacterium]|nr:DNA primase [Clostridia bacterium]